MLEFEKKASDDSNNTDSTITGLIDEALFEIYDSKGNNMTFVDKGNGNYEYNLNGNISQIHTTNRKDFYKCLFSLSKRKHKPMSKILDCIIITFNNHPEIMREFRKTLRNY